MNNHRKPSLIVALSLLAATVAQAATPTVSVTREPAPFISGQPYTVSWSSTDVSQLSYECSASDGGYSGSSGNLAANGSITDIALGSWTGHPSSCIWTLKGTDGTTVTWQEPPRETVTIFWLPTMPPIFLDPNTQQADYNVDISYVPANQGGAGLPQTITYPSGKALTYQYDPTGQIASLNWNGQPLMANLEWTPLGVPKSWTWAFVNGNPTATRSYNTAGQMTSNGIASYQYDAAGRVSQITQNIFGPASTTNGPATPIAVTTSVTYDPVGRVTGVTHTPASVSLPPGTILQDITGPLAAMYSYDANGNRSQALYSQYAGSGGINSLTRDFTLNPAHNRVEAVRDIITLTSGGPINETRNLQWDASGHLTSDGKLSFEYDPRGRINKITNSETGEATTYLTNLLGQRVRKAQTGSIAIGIDTVYGEEALGLASYPLGNYQLNSVTATVEYIYLPTANGPMPVAVQIGSNLYAIDSDHLNTPRRLTDSNGRPVWQWVTTGFGELEPTTAATGFIRAKLNTGVPIANTAAVEFNLRYPGQQYDAETGLFYNHHRTYDPYLTVGYTQADPLGLDGGWNRRAYVDGNPVNWIDPEGQQAQAVPLVPIIVGGIVVGCAITPGCRDWVTKPHAPPIVIPTNPPVPPTIVPIVPPADSARPKTDSCSTSEYDSCVLQCGGVSKVKGCYVSIRWKRRIFWPSTGGLIDEPQRIVNCNCDDECP